MALIIAVANLKGGSTKTTTSAFIAHALAEQGLDVLAVDADPQGSLQEWSENAGWRIPVIGMPVKTLHTQLPGIARDRDVVVIDTPPMDKEAGIVASALRACSVALIPTAPTPIEVARLPKVRAALDDVGPLRPDSAPPPAMVVLTRTVPQAVSTGVWRDSLTADGWHVLKTEVRRLELLAQAYGDPIVDAAHKTAYGFVAGEMLDYVA